MIDLRTPSEHRAEAFAACDAVAKAHPGMGPDDLFDVLSAMVAERGISTADMTDAHARVRALLWANQVSMAVRARRASRGEPLCLFGYSCHREARPVARGHALVNLCAHHEAMP
jgi:hypothetical protein